MSEVENGAPDRTPLLTPRTRAMVAGMLLVFGVQLWLVAGRGYFKNAEPRVLAVLLIASAIPAVARFISRGLDRVRAVGRRPVPTVVVAILLAVVSSAYIVHDAHGDGRALAPRYQDEFSYLVQTQQVARGHLWMPAHPLGDFFESFQLLSRPVYASIYFPGTAIMHAPGVWLGLPEWGMPVVCAGATVGVFYGLVTYLFDGVLGFLAAVSLLSLPIFRRMATKPMAQVPEVLLSLLAIGSYLAWRRGGRTRYAALCGLFLGWAAITRPVDAICVGLPIVVGFAIDLRRTMPPLRRGLMVRTVLASVVCGLPFLAVQGVFNLGVTGNLFQTPFRYYLDRDLPGTQFGFHPVDPGARPASGLVQKKEYYELTAGPEIREHRPGAALTRWLNTILPRVLVFATAHPMLMTLIPVGAMALLPRRRWVVAAVGPLFVGLYFFYPFYFPHYGLIVAPALILCVVGSVEACRDAFPRLGPGVVVFLVGAIAALTIGRFREIDRLIIVDPLMTPQLARIDELLPALPGRAIVLFRYTGGGVYEQEPVYNADVAWPDDARVIRAHDLGAGRNPELYRYYAQRQPDREVYRYDRADDTLTRLGNVRDLAEAAAPSRNGPAGL